MSQEIDYAKVLADLEARKAAIEATIAGIRQILGQEAPEVSPAPAGAAQRQEAFKGEVTPGAFHGLSMIEAAKKYLAMVKVKKKTKEICDALLKGGIETTAKNFYSNMYTIMLRDRDFIRLGKYWGLAEWHPTRLAAPTKPRKAKRARRTRKASSGEKPAGEVARSVSATTEAVA